ncbi:MAG TPA: prepilin peptidase [Pyrinomonadaceae bacterium]|nr:prepilin peptidase [Pyrinomonadaceae bacterium]
MIIIQSTVSYDIFTGVPDVVSFVFVFFFGAIIGSFLNVVIHRVPNEQSIVFTSACPKCGAPIKPYDNIPILSWLILGGKCRGCKAAISIRYPAVEFLTGVLFVLVFWDTGMSPMLPVYLAFVAATVALIFIDAEHMILPNVITYPMLVIALAVRIVFPLVFAQNYFTDTQYFPLTLLSGQPAWMVSLAGAILGALVGGGSLWLVGALWKKLRGVDAMGLGDVKMMFGVGALLGWRLAFLSIFLGAFSGALIGLAVIAKQKDRDLQTQIPFGIFLGTGSILALLFGDQLINWYMQSFVR